LRRYVRSWRKLTLTARASILSVGDGELFRLARATAKQLHELPIEELRARPMRQEVLRGFGVAP
jgi:hypothetical protein